MEYGQATNNIGSGGSGVGPLLLEIQPEPRSSEQPILKVEQDSAVNGGSAVSGEGLAVSGEDLELDEEPQLVISTEVLLMLINS